MACSNSACTVAYFIGKRPHDGSTWVYLETIGGGSGARAHKDGLDGVHVHTTNTSNLPVEALEIEYPLLLTRYELVEDSGGVGQYRGGMGLRRVYQATHDCRVRVDLTRQRSRSWGLFGGGAGRARQGRGRTGRGVRGRFGRLEDGPVVRAGDAGRRRLRPARASRACGRRARSRRRRHQRCDGARHLRSVGHRFASASGVPPARPAAYLAAMKRTILLTLLLAGCSGSGLSTSSGPNGETIVGNDVSVQVTGAANPNAAFTLAQRYCRKNDRDCPCRRPVRHHGGVRLREGRVVFAGSAPLVASSGPPCLWPAS